MAEAERRAAAGEAHDQGVRRLVGGVAVVTLLALALAGLSLRQGLVHHERLALLSSQNLARLLGQSIEDLIGKVDVALLQVKDEAERQLPGGSPGRSLDALVARELRHVPELRSLRVTDASGMIVHGLTEGEVGSRQLGDREYFVRLRDQPKADLVLSRPLKSRVTGEWILVLGRRIEGPGGAFAGAVLAAVPLAWFQGLFASVRIGDKGGITLRDGEMGILARHPPPPDPARLIGNKVLSPELRRPFEAGLPEATFFTPLSWDNVPKAVSYRKVGPHPLFVAVGIASHDYLAEWRAEALATLVLVAFFLAVVLSFGVVVRRELVRRRERAAEALAEVRTLHGVLPICSSCKKIRDEEGAWQQLESYISRRTDTLFSHGFCKECFERLYPELAEERREPPKPG